MTKIKIVNKPVIRALKQLDQMGLRAKKLGINPKTNQQVFELVNKHGETPVAIEFGVLNLNKTVTGSGKYPKDAIIDLIKKIKNKDLFIDPYTFDNRIIKAPNFDEII